MPLPTKIGIDPGIDLTGTIIAINEKSGEISVELDRAPGVQAKLVIKLPIPSAWSGQSGEFIGGVPKRGAAVAVRQGAGGKWFFSGYLKSDVIYTDILSSQNTTKMSVLKPGRAVIQTESGNRLFIDPNSGVHFGNYNEFLQADPKRSIISHNYSTEMKFTSSGNSIDGIVKRDLIENTNRNSFNSALESQSYDDLLFVVPMDPSSTVSKVTSGSRVRNLPFAEQRSIVYEFDNSYDFLNDEEESKLYEDPDFDIPKIKINRHKIRTSPLSLSLNHPNNLIEEIKGTVVDSFGNILDLNRNILPIGKLDDLSFRVNTNLSDAFNKIRSQLRKSIAYHFEINTRKGSTEGKLEQIPDVLNREDYSRNRSRFFVDIDKEGQFKINIPSSSEIGNVPLLTRYENFSVTYAKDNSDTDPREFIREENNKEILLDSFAGQANISLENGENVTSGADIPIDRISGQQIKLGTAFHDITKTCSEFQTIASYLQATPPYKLVSHEEDHHLNEDYIPLEKIVSDSIVVSGEEANAGGRSGTINCDGFICMNVGANTADRQSLWLDCAGGIVSRIGRDKQGISSAASYDGDVLIQIGGPGIGNSYDSRFKNENDAFRDGTLDIRVLSEGGHMSIIKVGPKGIDIVTSGKMTFSSQQDMIFYSNGHINFEAPTIMMHAKSTKRIIRKLPADTI